MPPRRRRLCRRKAHCHHRVERYGKNGPGDEHLLRPPDSLDAERKRLERPKAQDQQPQRSEPRSAGNAEEQECGREADRRRNAEKRQVREDPSRRAEGQRRPDNQRRDAYCVHSRQPRRCGKNPFRREMSENGHSLLRQNYSSIRATETASRQPRFAGL